MARAAGWLEPVIVPWEGRAMRKFVAIARAIAPGLSMKWFGEAAGPGGDLPALLMQAVDSKTADDVVEIIYLQNDTDRTYAATVRANFFTTVDDESGAALHHGPPGTEVELAPGERARVGDILGWEWDSARGLTIEFRHAEESGARSVHYNLAAGGRTRHVAGLGEVYEVAPSKRAP